MFEAFDAAGGSSSSKKQNMFWIKPQIWFLELLLWLNCFAVAAMFDDDF